MKTSNTYIDKLSRPSPNDTRSVVGRGAAMWATTRRPGSDECFNCGEIGHRSDNCYKLQRHRQSQMHSNTKKGMKGDQGKICSYHQCGIHNDFENLKH